MADAAQVRVESAPDNDGRAVAVAVKSVTGVAGAERLAREAEALGQARHPGVVELVSFTRTDRGAELRTVWAGGHTLATYPSLPAPQAAGVVVSLATTLADLHDLGVVHGRVEAPHVLVAVGGRPVLCGFAGSGRTGTPVPADAPGHDPAHGPGSPLTPAADVFGIGTVLRRLVADVEAEPIPEQRPRPRRRRRSWTGYDARSLLVLADQATADDPARRPSARLLAASLQAAVPAAHLVTDPPPAHHDMSAASAAAHVAADEPPVQPACTGATFAEPEPEPDPAALPEAEAAAAAAWSAGAWSSPGEVVEPPEPPWPRRASRGGSDRPVLAPTPPAPPPLARRHPIGSRPALSVQPVATGPHRRQRRGGGRRVPPATVAAVLVGLACVSIGAWTLRGGERPAPLASPTADNVAPVARLDGRTASTTSTTSTLDAPGPSPQDAETVPARTCPPVPPDGTTADLDGDGCDEAVELGDGEVQAAGRRYQVGAPGDHILLGDWHCQGRATVGLVRPGTGEVFFFRDWAEADRDLVVGPAARIDRPAAAHADDVDDDGCDELVVRDEAGGIRPVSPVAG